MSDNLRIPAEALHTPCKLDGLLFHTTAQLEDLPGLLGQGELAREARRQDSRALVLSVRSLPEARAQIRVLPQTSDCPLVLVF